jgi:hypothetical protein
VVAHAVAASAGNASFVSAIQSAGADGSFDSGGTTGTA